ncbi:MAG: acetyl-CoA carboxylase carboxyltransferase subunit alpha [Armatimonadetes bacterium]|nr:acetyl-CoA carboxylase carboxyltransferase subunit alpha [Armatimonadota bacterium]
MSTPAGQVPGTPPVACPRCQVEHPFPVLAANLHVCPSCGAHLGMSALERIALLADPGTFREIDRGMVSVDPLEFMDQKPYRQRLLEARQRTGLREAVVVGQARIEGRPAVLAVFDFEFMGGTMGSVVGEKIGHAFEFALRRRLPVVSVATSGGARMQEGMLSLMQMAKTSAAQARHHRAGLAYISILANPTFGGVAASFASLGDVIIAEPGALVGFVGPRVIEMTLGEKLPPGSHSAEALYEAGMIDLLLPRPRLRETVAYLVSHLSAGTETAGLREEAPRPAAPHPVAPWEAVQLARHSERPTTHDYIERLFTRFVELHGDRLFGDDSAIVAGLGEVEGRTVMVIGHERGRTSEERARGRGGMALPEGYRKSLRLMELAAKFRLPVITFIDTPGAYPGYESERRGIAQALARNLQAMAGLPTPVISVVIGEGGSGGALALGVADRVLMLENAIYSVISPEGAAAILWRDAAKAAEVAGALKLTAADLQRLGIIDRIIPEPPGGAHTDHGAAAREVRRHLAAALREMGRIATPRLLRQRYDKFRHIGRVGVYWREVVREEMQEVLDGLSRVLQRHERPRASDQVRAKGGGTAGQP